MNNKRGNKTKQNIKNPHKHKQYEFTATTTSSLHSGANTSIKTKIDINRSAP